MFLFFLPQSADMSAASNLRSEDQFLCSICLDVFTDPVSTPCGHNFCKTCISQHWDMNQSCQCPMCKETFSTRPQLRVNTFISEMVAQFRREAQQKASSSSSEQQAAKPGEVPCDVCTGTRLKALKSCLVCQTSYCQTHLEPHLTVKRLKRHQLIDAVENLEGWMCTKHDKPLELFCKTDQTCVCMLCSVLDHKNHEFVPLREEYEGKKAELEKTEAEIQQMIQKRRLKIQEITESVKMSKDAADRQKAEGVQVFTALMESVERRLKELMKEIEDKQETTEKQAEGLIKDLEQEISELMERSSEVEQLSRSEDHLHLLQSFSNLKAAPPTKDWTEVRVHPPSYEGTVGRAVAQLEETVWKPMKKKLFEAELQRVQQYEVDVTLDPDTANPYLILSDDGKQVYCGDVEKNLPDNPERFSLCPCVLGEQSFSSGRFYFEVQVKGKTKWTLGVATESINRKGQITASPQDGFWTVWLRNGNEYKALDDPSVDLCLHPGPEKVGVFVDYEEGLVSFYDVGAAALIYSFTGCSFTHKLHPYFGPCINDGGKNSAPLIICPVNQTESIND
ncbi:E3 ubiquitin-protein ligase TRIM21-like isoform X1 [Pelmatolapia mariae]|uniref:E3 ubiquitin-protein ligase TRIM21-like isoform X1 n=1 Tax=Pelmatolapia mariae TaxID=158779 RepID=UPI002FE5E71C